MCGIVGILLLHEKCIDQVYLEQLGEHMTEKIAHRGPDADGIWSDGRVCLGHRRLSVIDLTETGAQPMLEPSGRICVTYNGEVYNFQELRSQLKRKGYTFKGTSDTEVIVNGFLEWGSNLFTKLRGMFAIGIWDRSKRQLYLVRDRFGKKPLYYYADDKAFVFSSEIKSILCWPYLKRSPNYQAIHRYLTFGYTAGEQSAFTGIKKLLPGHKMTVDLNGASKSEPYWSLPAYPGSYPANRKDIIHEFVERLDEAVRIRMEADVPVGAFLSGGCDSSAVVAMMSKYAGDNLKTFSVGFQDESDETKYAQMVASRYNTDHYPLYFSNNIANRMNELVWHYGEPYADSSAIVTFEICRAAREHVKVVLTGDGADEMLLGYPRYDRYRQFINETKPHTLHGYNNRIVTPLDLYGVVITYFNEPHKLLGYNLAVLPHINKVALDDMAHYFDTSLPPEITASIFDVHTYLPEDILVKVDIASMAHGLEARSPFLDHELVEWISQIPLEHRVWDGEAKALLKHAMEPYLPREVMYREKKGFSVPVHRWFQNELRDFVEQQLLSERFQDRQILNSDFVRTIINDHVSGKQLHQNRIWNLLFLELWFQTFIDSDNNLPLDRDYLASSGLF